MLNILEKHLKYCGRIKGKSNLVKLIVGKFYSLVMLSLKMACNRPIEGDSSYGSGAIEEYHQSQKLF